ncbi:hypothetical protein P3X46_008049 [Hevea brasiliensis]|uniref:Protein LURP-one-related 8 n=1 Tax=Hevea brasiliensis TaxID=3981 RepID=A0ABQ9MJB1_HEVBR|nr:protein LURP-one-related 8 [Hevea brasiliensis]KAJ9179715.1 hypothetical protein P3X46_008049 [Hevea brasiliensis]
MTKVHPNIADTVIAPVAVEQTKLKSFANLEADGTVLTVWKKSLLFNCNGFTVFDAKGNLVFRVDNYMAGSGTKGEIILMDAGGKPLLTIRRKRLSLTDNWLVYNGETAVNPRFSMRKHVNILNNKSLAHLSSVTTGSRSSCNGKNIVYEIEGSYAQRTCAVYDENRRKVAEIKQKEAVGGVAFGVDVFRLIVGPKMDTSVAMAIVILLDQMFGSSRRFST